MHAVTKTGQNRLPLQVKVSGNENVKIFVESGSIYVIQIVPKVIYSFVGAFICYKQRCKVATINLFITSNA